MACVVRVVREVDGCGAVALAVVGVARGCMGEEFAQGVVCVSAVVCGVVYVFGLWWAFRGRCWVVWVVFSDLSCGEASERPATFQWILGLEGLT